MAVIAPAALADKPVEDPDCSFETGKTTCVKTELVDSSTTPVVVGFGAEGKLCEVYTQYSTGTQRSFFKAFVYQDYQTDTYETTTTVYRGKSDIVESADKTTSQTTKPVGDTYYRYYTGPDPVFSDPEAYEKRSLEPPHRCIYLFYR